MRVLLNNINNVIYIQTRNSRRSLIEYRKRRAILKDYNIIESSKDQNVLEKLVQPLDKIVPINETKTSLTVDVLDSETLPLISEWRKNHLIRRARRILPLPISLTTDDKLGFVWKQTYIRSLAKKTSEPGKQLLDEIPEFLRLMFENNPDRFRSNFPDLYAKFIQLNGNVSKSLETSVDESQSNREVYFPFHENLKQNIDSQFNNASQLLSINDRDYQNYLNHNKFLEYLSSNLNSFPIAEYRPEIKNFASQIWLRYCFHRFFLPNQTNLNSITEIMDHLILRYHLVEFRAAVVELIFIAPQQTYLDSFQWRNLNYSTKPNYHHKYVNDVNF